MINTSLLKEESDQVIYLYANSKWNKAKFMWFHKGKIEIMLDETGTLLPVNKQNWNKLSFTHHENI